MGEYAKYNGQSVKIGTCEDMYYLRFDQRHLVEKEANSLDPVKDIDGLRFRFPFPDEDSIEPGNFEHYNKAIWLHLDAPDEIDHYSVQLVSSSAPAGHVMVCLPCPYSKEAKESKIKYGYNGYSGGIGISQQRLKDNKLMLVCQCGACGAKWRKESLEDCADVLEAIQHECDNIMRQINNFQNMGEKYLDHIAGEETRLKYWLEVSKRITDGYKIATNV